MISAPDDSWRAFFIANLATAAVALSVFGGMRFATALEVARVLGFVGLASLVVIVALRWLRALFGSRVPRGGAASGVMVGLAVLGAMFAPTLFIRVPPNTNETQTLGDIRTLISGQAAYQAASGGVYGAPECLAAPTSCLQGYSVNQPTFLDSQLASLSPRSGYKRTFHPGAAAPPPADGKAAPKGGLASYAYTAIPVRVGLTGVRGFCADSTGRICFTTDGSVPAMADGLCAATCPDLR